MRNAFADELLKLAEQDERIVLLSGDIGNRMFDKYKARFPDRFYNCGVAEANMVSMAAGLAMSGMRPVAYTIVPFLTTRCLEQIRVDLCYHHVPVVLVGVGGGMSYASLGATHHSCEDIGMLRLLPEMTVVCPGDAVEVRGALRAALTHPSPVYVRIGKKNEPVIHKEPLQFAIGRSITIRPGRDVALLSAGNILPVVCRGAELLAGHDVSARVESFHTVKPLDERCLEEVFHQCDVVATVEEHSRLGGLGTAVAEWLADRPAGKAKFVRLGTPDEFLHVAASQDHARHLLGLTPESIADALLSALPQRELNEDLP
jgi:transketolase